MKSKVTNLIKAVVFSVMGVIMFIALQNFFIPDSSSKRSNADKTIQGLGGLEENTLDVVFLGPSSTRLSISPMKMYEDAKIKAYNLSTDGTPIEASYYLLKDTFSRQKPSIVVLEANHLFQLDNAETALRWRHVLDNYPMSPLKYEMAKSYAELEAGDGIMSVIFPIEKYHTRWSELTSADFKLQPPIEDFYSCGETVYSIVSGDTYPTLEEINSIAERNQQPATISQYEDGIWSVQNIDEKLNVPVISERNIKYLLKMKELCEINGAQLVLSKMPVNKFIQYYSGAWTRQKSDMVKEIANTQGLKFIDLIYDRDVGIDWATETCDGGFHLNLRGAKKTTEVMEQYLLDNFSFPQTSSAQYDEYLALYHKVNDVAMLQSETDFHAYLQRLIDNKDKYLILISSDEDFMLAMDDCGYQLLEELGLQMTKDAAFRDAYLAILDQGRLRYEAVSGRRIDYTTTIDDVNISMSSAGWNVGAYCKLSVNGRDYARSVRGLNFVVYDPESKLVIDSVSFDTSLPTMKVTRNGATTESLLRAYEKKMCF